MDERNNEVIEILNELIVIFKEWDIVRKILRAKDVKAVYNEEKAVIELPLERFKEVMKPYIGELESPISNPSKIITSENVVEICFILLMSECVDDYDLCKGGKGIESALNQVEGDLHEIAKRLSAFLYDDIDFFEDHEEGELLQILIL